MFRQNAPAKRAACADSTSSLGPDKRRWRGHVKMITFTREKYKARRNDYVEPAVAVFGTGAKKEPGSPRESLVTKHTYGSRKSTRLNSSHVALSRMPSSA